jgi:hypothetical protein
MPKRTIKTGIGTYVNKQGVAEFGFQGDEVEVHADHVDRFDELNVQPGGDEPHQPRRESVDLLSSPAVVNSGNESGLNTTVSDKEAAASTAGDDSGDKPARSRRK